MRITRRTLQVGLGFLWLIDGVLQCQRFMFTKAFALTGLAPVGEGQPGVVAHSVHWAVGIVVAHPALTNSGFAAIQIALGLGLLWKRSARWTLVASIGWAGSVWWFGEGLGGLTAGGTLLSGEPGAALLYAVIAMLALPGRDGDSAAAPSAWAVPSWVGLWAFGAGMQIAAGNNTGAGFGSMFADAAGAAPRWVARLDVHLAHLHYSNAVVAVIVGMMVVISMWALVPGAVRTVSLAVGGAIALTSWVLVQGLGDVTTGQATDVNTGPLILLLALAAFGAQSAPWELQSRRGVSSAAPRARDRCGALAS